MDLNLSNKVALVTGGTRGIGRAIAERLAKAGSSVVICGRTGESTAKAVNEMTTAGFRVAGMAANVANEKDVKQLFALCDSEFGGLDILVNNAGIGIFAPVADLTPAQWREVIDTNLNGVFYCSHEAVPRFRQRGGGWIVNISSLAARNPFSGGSVYNASKFGLNGFTEALMLDHRQEGIKTTTIMPGSVSTDFGISAKAAWKIAPEDIADTVAMILSMPDRTLISRVEIRPSRPPK